MAKTEPPLTKCQTLKMVVWTFKLGYEYTSGSPYLDVKVGNQRKKGILT